MTLMLRYSSSVYFNIKFSSPKAYLEYMKDVSNLLGAPEAKIEIEMLDTLRFEIELAKISVPR